MSHDYDCETCGARRSDRDNETGGHVCEAEDVARNLDERIRVLEENVRVLSYRLSDHELDWHTGPLVRRT